jgi:tetratricopeptide (TPR) repeat protein
MTDAGDAMDKKNRLLDLLSLAYQEELAFVASLSDAELDEQGTMERWSAKDTIAHNAFWKQHRAEQIADPENPALTGFRDFEQINAQNYEEYLPLSWEDVLENAREAYDYLSAQVSALSEHDLIDPERYPWLNGRPMWRMVVNSGYNHPLNHIAGYLNKRGKVHQASDMQENTAARLQEMDDDAEWRGIIYYNLACYYATTDQPQRAIHHLSRALILSPGLVEWARQDNDLMSLQGEPEYEGLYEQR